MTPEGRIKQWLKNQLKIKYPSCKLYSPRGGPFGKAGTADLICCINGFYVEIEVKAENNDITPLQLYALHETMRAGGIAAKIVGKDTRKLNAIFKEIDSRHELYMASAERQKTI